MRSGGIRRALAVACGATALAAMVGLSPGWSAAGVAGHGPCKPRIFTTANVGAALRIAAAKLLTVPLPSSPIPTVPGQAQVAGKMYECEWDLVHFNQAGIGEGRVSLLAFATPEDADAWFTAYTAQEKPACKTIGFTATACLAVAQATPGVFPLFQALQGRFVVWIHMKQRKLDPRPLESLALAVLVRARALVP